jgi:hypothetical protein
MQTVSKRFSRTTDLNVIFVCCLVTPAGKNLWRYWETKPVRRKHGSDVATGYRYIGQGVSYVVTEMIMLFQYC